MRLSHSCFYRYLDSASLKIIKIRSEFILRSNLSKQIAQILCSNPEKVILMLFPVEEMKPAVFKISLAELPAQLLRDSLQLKLQLRRVDNPRDGWPHMLLFSLKEKASHRRSWCA